MAYTNIPKPTGAGYTNVNPVGKTNYDESTITYDDPLIFYDGIDPSAYSNILKPLTTLTWDLATFTWNSANFTWDNAVGYTNISKPT